MVLGAVELSTKRNLVESSNKIRRMEEELEIVKHECKDMLMFYKEKKRSLKELLQETNGM